MDRGRRGGRHVALPSLRHRFRPPRIGRVSADEELFAAYVRLLVLEEAFVWRRRRWEAGKTSFVRSRCQTLIGLVVSLLDAERGACLMSLGYGGAARLVLGDGERHLCV